MKRTHQFQPIDKNTHYCPICKLMKVRKMISCTDGRGERYHKTIVSYFRDGVRIYDDKLKACENPLQKSLF